MPDIIDASIQTEEMFISAAISKARISNEPKLAPKGTCYYCKGTVEGKQLFCDMFCLEDYELLKRNGKL